jgi:hypothetical protein
VVFWIVASFSVLAVCQDAEDGNSILLKTLAYSQDIIVCNNPENHWPYPHCHRNLKNPHHILCYHCNGQSQLKCCLIILCINLYLSLQYNTTMHTDVKENTGSTHEMIPFYSSVAYELKGGRMKICLSFQIFLPEALHSELLKWYLN